MIRYTLLTTSLSPRFTIEGSSKQEREIPQRLIKTRYQYLGSREVDNNALKVDQGGNTSTRKRKPTPTAVTNFKRSKRQDGHNNDYKHSSSTSRSKDKDKKKASGLGNSAGKLHTFFIPQVEFLDLAEIDRCVSTQLIHPHNPVHVLQKMAQEVCGIPPMEVSTEMLLEEHKPSSQEKSSTNPQIVPYGYF
jgi:hypothetical protein